MPLTNLIDTYRNSHSPTAVIQSRYNLLVYFFISRRYSTYVICHGTLCLSVTLKSEFETADSGMGDSYGLHHNVSRLMIVRQWRRHGVDWTGVDMSTQLLLEVAVVKL